MPEIDHNLKKVKDAIREAIGEINQHKEERDDTNAQIQAIREKLKALGIPKKAFDMALSYVNMDPDKREGFDIAYALVREVAGLPLQDDLFTAAERKANETVQERPGADPGEIAKVIASQDAEAVKGKTVLPSSTGAGTIN